MTIEEVTVYGTLIGVVVGVVVISVYEAIRRGLFRRLLFKVRFWRARKKVKVIASPLLWKGREIDVSPLSREDRICLSRILKDNFVEIQELRKRCGDKEQIRTEGALNRLEAE